MIKKKKLISVFFIVLAVLCMSGRTGPVQAGQKTAWDYGKTIKKDAGAFIYSAHPSKNGKEAWIYFIKVKGGRRPSSLSIPDKIKGRKVTCIGGDARAAEEGETVNLFYDWIERYHNRYHPPVSRRHIKKIVIPESVEVILPTTFCGLSSLSAIRIPKKVKELKEETFYACTGLKSVTLSADLKRLDPAAFQNCPALERIRIPSGNKAFQVKGKCIIERKTKALVYVLPQSGTLRIPEGVRIIRQYALNNCTAETVEIPASVTKIEGQAFYRPLLGQNEYVRDVTVSPDNRTYARDGQCIYHRKNKSLAVAVPDENGCLYISDKVEELANAHSLVNCELYEKAYLKKVVLPKTLKSVVAPSFSDLGRSEKVYFTGEEPPKVKKRIEGTASLPIFTDVYVPAGYSKVYRAWYKKNHCGVDRRRWHTFDPNDEI